MFLESVLFFFFRIEIILNKSFFFFCATKITKKEYFIFDKENILLNVYIKPLHQLS